MPITKLRPVLRAIDGFARPTLPIGHPEKATEPLGAMLLREGIVGAHHILQAIAYQARHRGRLTDILLSRGLVDEAKLYQALTRHWQIGLVDLAKEPPNPLLIDRIGAVFCLRHGLVPWRVVGGATVIVTAYPEDFHRHRDDMERAFGPVIVAAAPARQIGSAILHVRGAALAQRAESRVSDAESCRNFNFGLLLIPVCLGAIALAVMAVLWPVLLLAGFTFLALLSMLAFIGLKLATAHAATRPAPEAHAPPHIAHLPVVSAIVALYRESDIAQRLVERLGKLDYPQELLDVLLAVEAEDTMTRDALAKSDLPHWMRVIVVPKGSIKTKPRALNFALDHCRGSIVGIYDAEDAPEPGQIRKVVDRFHQRGANVACLQGVLDFYNPRTNWLSRCFTIEYACWFRLLLPGLERVGMAVPLGGTTLFFRRSALEELGAWDAHNVTEDADLGIRLARHGYRTELIDTVTFEEACCRPVAWIKQRSRWIKGFMMTWVSHMRDPARLWRELGPRKFAGFQILLLGSFGHALLAPLLWSFWIVPFGIAHPVATLLGPRIFTAIWVLFFFAEALAICIGVTGLSRTGHRLSKWWVPTLYLYQPLATFAAYKALWELLSRPFYWEKTSHGHFDRIAPEGGGAAQRVFSEPVSTRSRVSYALEM